MTAISFKNISAPSFVQFSCVGGGALVFWAANLLDFTSRTGELRSLSGFSLTLCLESRILESLRGVAPGVCVCSPGLGWSIPWRDRLEQAWRRLDVRV